MACALPQEVEKKLSDDRIFCEMNKSFISLKEEEVKRNNVILKEAVDVLINMMKATDPLFARTYNRIIFGGSFYKGTKVSSPSEFDLDIIIQLPIDYTSITFHPGPPGYVKINVQNKVPCKTLTPAEQSKLNNLISNGFIDQNKFRQWIESIICRVINQLPRIFKQYVLYGQLNGNYGIRAHKSGPAFTITLSIPNGGTICVDLVPALAFSQSLPRSCCRRSLHQFQNKTWLAVPKPYYEMKNGKIMCEFNCYWRLSLYPQEKECFERNGRVKPVIRHMKKLRDQQNWKSISSYYIETLFLNNLDSIKNLHGMPFTLFFYKMLQIFHTACNDKKIDYYWNPDCNLLEKVDSNEILNVKNRLNRIIVDIERRITTNEFIIAEYILTVDERTKLKAIFDTNQSREVK